MELAISIISLIASLSSILFALLAFRRNERIDHKKEGKHEGTTLRDIAVSFIDDSDILLDPVDAGLDVADVG